MGANAWRGALAIETRTIAVHDLPSLPVMPAPDRNYGRIVRPIAFLMTALLSRFRA